MESPLPKAFISASLAVHRRKKSRIRLVGSPDFSSAFSAAVNAESINLFRPWGMTSSSTSTPTRPWRAMAIRPCRPLWLTLKLTAAGTPPTSAKGLPNSPYPKASSRLLHRSRPHRRARSAARHRTYRRLVSMCAVLSLRACSVSHNQPSASASHAAFGERSTYTIAIPSISLKGLHHAPLVRSMRVAAPGSRFPMPSGGTPVKPW